MIKTMPLGITGFLYILRSVALSFLSQVFLVCSAQIKISALLGLNLKLEYSL